MTRNIPVIDLQDFPSQSKKLIEACEEWGCFRLINHSIPTTLMSEMKSAVRFLLDLPIEIKQRNTEVIAGSGYVGPSKANPLYEGLGLYDIGSPDAVRTFCDQLDSSPQLRFNSPSPLSHSHTTVQFITLIFALFWIGSLKTRFSTVKLSSPCCVVLAGTRAGLRPRLDHPRT